MSSGNPFGLSEISHFGTFQRVGGKAGGFINKKFFHPSSFKNQERLWKVMTEDEQMRKKEAELEKRREEERQVEALRKQMYLAGQGSQADSFSAASARQELADLSTAQKTEAQIHHEEFKKRRTALKVEKLQKEKALANVKADDDDEGSDSSSEEEAPVNRELAKSSYRENLRILGHTEVWGSFYLTEKHKWGFGCCKCTTKSQECTHCIKEAEAEKAKEVPLTKRARRRQEKKAEREKEAAGADAGSGQEEAAAAAGEAAPGAAPINDAAASSSRGARAAAEAAEPASGASSGAKDTQEAKPLIDEEWLRRAQETKAKKRKLEEDEKEAKKAKQNAYLGDLLSNPKLA